MKKSFKCFSWVLVISIILISSCSNGNTGYDPMKAVDSNNKLIRKGSAIINASSDRIQFTGEWENKLGKYYTNKADSMIRYNITTKDTIYSIYADKGPNGGKIEIALRGQSEETVDLYSAKEQKGVEVKKFEIPANSPDAQLIINFIGESGKEFYFDSIRYNSPMADEFFVNSPNEYNFTQLFEAGSIETYDGEIKYRLYTPENMEPGKKYSMVTLLHGMGERGNNNTAQFVYNDSLIKRLLDEKDKYPCYIFVPQCPAEDEWTWNAKHLIDFIDDFGDKNPVDMDNLVIAGLSMGGYGTWHIISEYPGKFKTAIPICGEGDLIAVVDAKETRIWAFHGENDEIVAIDKRNEYDMYGGTRALIRALQEAGGKPIYYEYPNVDHNSWAYAYTEKDLLRWMFED